MEVDCTELQKRERDLFALYFDQFTPIIIRGLNEQREQRGFYKRDSGERETMEEVRRE